MKLYVTLSLVLISITAAIVFPKIIRSKRLQEPDLLHGIGSRHNSQDLANSVEAPSGTTPITGRSATGAGSNGKRPRDRGNLLESVAQITATESNNGQIALKKLANAMPRWNSEPYGTPQPAAWVELPSLPGIPDTNSYSQDIQTLAEDSSKTLLDSGLDPDSDDYQKLWMEVTEQSDQYIRARYGDQVWIAHHIQANHLAYQAEPTND